MYTFCQPDSDSVAVSDYSLSFILPSPRSYVSVWVKRTTAVEENLGRKPTGVETRVVLPVSEVVFVGNGAELIGLAVADGADEGLQVVAVLDKAPGEVIEQGGMGWRIGNPHVVLGIY